MTYASRPRLRLLATNDLFGAMWPTGATGARLPGYRALRRAADRLRAEAQVSLWCDAGDFSPGLPAYYSGGRDGFTSTESLGIDVGTIGNHEFDWGEDHLRAELRRVPHPLVCANYSVGLPASTIIAAGGIKVGVIGATHARLRDFPGMLRDYGPQPDIAETASTQAAALRSVGAEFVVLLLHDGVDWSTTASSLDPDPSRMARLCMELAGRVDAVVAGHTLGRYAGHLHGVPFVQPWAFGMELGLIDFHADRTASVALHPVAPSAEDEPLASPIVAHSARGWGNHPGHDISLVEALAHVIRRRLPSVVVVLNGWEFQSQRAPVDGKFTILGPGPVTEADIARVTPWTDDRLRLATASQTELEQLVSWCGGAVWGPPVATPSPAVRPAGDVTIAMGVFGAGMYNEPHGPGRLDWRPSTLGMRDVLRALVEAPVSDCA